MASSSTRPMLCARGAKHLWAKGQHHPQLFPFLAPCIVSRQASGGKGGKKSGQNSAGTKTAKKKKGRPFFARGNIKDADKFSLCDAMRYIRAYEVGQDPAVSKYELAINLDTYKNGPVIRNRLRFPHVVKSPGRTAVICPPDSSAAKEAIEAGAALVGEEDVLDAIKAGDTRFKLVLCHPDSATALAQSGVARILGPRGLMPNAKQATVTKDIGARLKHMVGESFYREKIGVVRTPIGQLKFTPAQLEQNIAAFMAQLKLDVSALSENIPKTIHEVVPDFEFNTFSRFYAERRVQAY